MPATNTSAGQGALFESNQAASAPSSDWSLDATSPKFEPIALAMKRAEVELICHNAKFDLAVLEQLGVVFEKLTFDTMLAQFVCDPASPLGLKQLANIHLGWTMTEIKELIGIGKKQISMREVPIALVAPYAAADAAATWELAVILRIQLKQLGQEELLRKVELPLVPVLLEMETNGVAIDVKHLGTVSVEIDARIKELERLIFEHAGGGLFNVNSPQQLSEVLFGRLQLPTDASSRTSTKSKSGATIWSTAAAVLENLRGQHPIIEPILEHRELAKLKGTYVDALPELINKRTGRIHTDFNQAGAITGRLSSSNPNLQNIPVKTEMGRRVRQAFIARKGGRILSADYSQVELRVLAHLADDARMKEAFARNEDIHATTASAVYETPLEFVTPAQRNNAKRINFGIAYGMGAFALAQNTGMTNAEAGEFIKRYFERFPAVKEFLETTKKHAAQQGYVETVLGRRRYFPELSRPGTSEMLKRRAEREAINHPVQGSAADIMKLAMINIHHALHAPHADGRRGHVRAAVM